MFRSKSRFDSALAACAVFVFAASAALVPSAFAQAELETRHARVAYADLDPSQDADARRLYHRLRRAAAEVCPAPAVSLQQRFDRDCRDAALDQAVAQIDAPALDAIHRARAAPELETQIASAP